MIHGDLILEFCLVLKRAVEKEIPLWAREEDGIIDVLVEKIL